MSYDRNSSYCINHPNRLAVAHCAVCRKPICEECVVSKDGFKCCSEYCLDKALKSTRQTEEVMAHKSSVDSRVRAYAIVKWLIIAAILVVVFLFRQPIIRTVKKWTGKTQSQIEQINEKNVQRDHLRRNQKEAEYERASGVNEQ